MGKLRVIFIIVLFFGGLYFIRESSNPGSSVMRIFGMQTPVSVTATATSTASTTHEIMPIPVENNSANPAGQGGQNGVQNGTNVASTTVNNSTSQVQPKSAGALVPTIIVQLTNVERLKKGLKPVLINTSLSASAEKKVKDIFDKQYFEHISPTGVGVSKLANQAGYDYVVVGENLALGSFNSNAAVVSAWMASPGHRANILDPRYQDIGVAVGRGMFQGSMQWVAVQHFGKPISACVQVDPTLKSRIDDDKNYITAQEEKITKLKNEIDALTGAAYREKAEEYNDYVKDYNTRLVTLQADVINYNKLADAFNACIGSNTVN